MKLVGNKSLPIGALSLVCGLAIMPVLLVLGSLALPMNEAALETWQHVKTHLLGDYTFNSLILVLGAGFLASVFGVTAALLIHFTVFPCKRFFSVALLLPLTLPSYIAAYSYASLLDYGSPIGLFLRDVIGVDAVPIRSIGGAIWVFGFTLFPYVYLFTRAMLGLQSANMIEAARALGASTRSVVWRIILPACRPGIVAGVSLVMMETLSDFGTVSLFGVQTFTTGIYKSWFSLQEPLVAAKLSGMLLVIVGLLIVVEKRLRGRADFSTMAGQYRTVEPVRLSRKQGGLVCVFCGALFAFGFLIPLTEILRNLVHYTPEDGQQAFAPLMFNSVTIALVAALVTSALALGFYTTLTQRSKVVNWLGLLLKTGYGIPGSVIAIGILITFVGLEKIANHIGINLWLTGGLLGLVLAYVIRFVAISMQHTESGMAKLTPELVESARSLGSSGADIIRRIHWPLLRTPLLAGFFMVFVDVMKELPATMILRPFDFSSLAVQTYQYASDDRMVEASPYALSIIIICAASTLLLQRVLK